MRFGTLRRRVERAEFLVQGRAEETRQHWAQTGTTWRDSWSPLRIVLVGLGLGFVSGRNESQAALGSIASRFGGLPRLLQAASTISALFTAHFARQASQHADPPTAKHTTAAADPGAAATAADATADQNTVPQAAEAATEVSEH